MKVRRYPSYHNMVVKFFTPILFLISFMVIAFWGIKTQDSLQKILGSDPFLIILFIGAIISILISYFFLSLMIFEFSFEKDYIEINYPFSFNKAKKHMHVPYETLTRVQYYGKGHDVNSVYKIVLVFDNNVKHKMVISDDQEDRKLYSFLRNLPVQFDSFINEN